MIVFADADLDLAAKEAVAFSLANCGQVCCAVERVYVASDVAENPPLTETRTSARLPENKQRTGNERMCSAHTAFSSRGLPVVLISPSLSVTV